VAVNTPRDPQGTFQPKLVGKRQTRLAGLEEKILSLYAGGMSVRDISEHLLSLYGTEIGRDTISRITDAVLEDSAAWRSRPLETLYPIVYFDALMVKMTEDRSVKTRACYLAVGVTLEGEREILGLWWQDTEGAKFWLAVLNDLHQRGVGDVLIACVDGLAGFPEAIAAVFPQAWVQTCIVHYADLWVMPTWVVGSFGGGRFRRVGVGIIRVFGGTRGWCRGAGSGLVWCSGVWFLRVLVP
jgi:putative transposase